jgi:hypothetical protein
MIQISFQLVVILISTDVLREIRRDIAENLAKRDFPDRRSQRSRAQLRERPSKDGTELQKSCRDSVLLSLQGFPKPPGAQCF